MIFSKLESNDFLQNRLDKGYNIIHKSIGQVLFSCTHHYRKNWTRRPVFAYI